VPAASGQSSTQRFPLFRLPPGQSASAMPAASGQTSVSACTADMVQAPPVPTPLTLPAVRLLHFNDIYELTERTAEPCGGAARFAHAVARLRADAAAANEACLLLFSGDALSPSLLSTITRGAHMAPVLNALRVDAACLGNH
jgi:2',3'-cyclic-nucleotide 2'-phosphodiesterase (5'-nucleotidase family)